MNRALWLRGDLRLGDHAGFATLPQSGDDVIVFFNLDPHLQHRLIPSKHAYLLSALKELDDQLAGGLTLFHCDPTTELPLLLSRNGVTKVVTHASVSPLQRRSLEASSQAMKGYGITLEYLDSPYAVAPGTLHVHHSHESPKGYRVYSPFYRAWRPHALDSRPFGRPTSLTVAPRHRAFELPRTTTVGGETRALSDLNNFLTQRSARYQKDRNFPGLTATSWLSTHLHFGTIHPRTIIAALTPHDETFLSELAWREFYADVLFRDPLAVNREIDPRFRTMTWRQEPDGPDLLRAWKDGMTGFPLVDAGMRELAATHLMHNRVRMITASFLVKDLHFDWRIGARYFEDQLLDGDIASNRLNWQWVAGTGTDAAPYYRVFNPTLQSIKFDPHGDYIKRWVPELRNLQGNAVHDPSSHINPISVGYVPPVIDHGTERAEALRLYSEAKLTGKHG